MFVQSSIMLEELINNAGEFAKLRDYVSNTTVRELRQSLSDALVEGSLDPHTLLHGVLTALQSTKEDADLDDKLLQVFVTTARLLAEQSVPARAAQEMLSSLESHVTFLRPTESCELFQHLLIVLQNQIPKNPKVFELLPPLMAHLEAVDADVGHVEIPSVDVDSDDSDAKENGKKAASTKGASPLEVLCDSRWNVGNVLALASAFSDAPLRPRQRDVLVRRLTARLKELQLTDLPALVHQIVLIASKADPKPALEGIFAYLAEADVKASEIARQSSASMDIICSGPDPQLLVQAEGTILLHFLYGVKQNQELGKNIFKVLKALGPQQSLEPFLLGLQLTILEVHTFEEQFLENARSSVAAAFRVTAKFYQSAWIRGLTSAPPNVEELVMRTAENCCDGRWDCVCPGLLKFALCLLDAAAPKGGALALSRAPAASGLTLDPISAQLSRLGHRVLRLVFKRFHAARADLLEAVVGRMVAHAQKPTWSVYTDLLERLVAQFPQLCLEHGRRLAQPLDYVSLLPPRLARSFVHAILPLLRTDQALRNQLMIVLRKALFLRQRESRSVGVSGLLLLLQHLRVVGSLSTQSSLSSQDANYVCSQVHVHQPASSLANESLCSELLSLLRRCVDQQDASQRTAIYAGLVEVLPRNKQLAVSVVSLLKSRLDAIFETDEDVQPPFRVESAATESDDGEPVAVLISRLGRAVRYCQAELLESDILDETQSAQSQLSQLCRAARASLRSVVRRMGRLDTDDVGIRSANASHSGTQPGDRSSRHLAVTALMCDVYDALMEFELEEDERRITEDFLRLFTKQELFRKVLKESTASAAKSKRGRGSSSSSSSSYSPPPADVFSLPNLGVAVARCLSQWAGEEEEEEGLVDTDARSKLTLHLLTTAAARVTALVKTTTRFGRKDEETLRQLARMAGVCLRHFLAGVERLGDGDTPLLGRAVMGASLDVSAQVLAGLLDKGEERLDAALQGLELDDSGDGGKTTVGALVKSLKTCCESILSGPFDQALQRHACVLLPLMVSLCRHRVADHVDWLGGLCDWLAEQLRTPSTGRRLDNATVRAVLGEALAVARLAKPGHCLLREVACDLHCRLGDVDQNTTLNETTEFSTITSRNAGPLVPLLTSQLERALDDCDWLLARLRLAWPREARKGSGHSAGAETLDMQERALCLRLGYLCNAANELVQSAVSPGPQADAVTSCLNRLYTTLGALAKHYLQLLKDGHGRFSPKFEKLVRLSGTCLSPHSYAFISYVQTTELQKARETAEGKSQKKKKQMNNSLNKTNAKKVAEPSGLKLSRSMKDSRTLPNLIFAIEQYERFLIQLSKRSKVDLMQHVKMSTARDFRINQNAVQEALARDAIISDDEEEEGQGEPSQVATQHSQQAAASRSELSFGEASVRSASQADPVAESDAPPAKARRLGSHTQRRS